MIETSFQYLFGERREHWGKFGEEICLNGEYHIFDYGNHVQVSFYDTTDISIIDIHRRWIFSPKAMIDGKELGKLTSRALRFTAPDWKYGYEYKGKLYRLIISEGLEKSLSLRISDWKRAFKKAFRLNVLYKDEIIASISGPLWTMKDKSEVKLQINKEGLLIPVLVLVFMYLSEKNMQYAAGDAS